MHAMQAGPSPLSASVGPAHDGGMRWFRERLELLLFLLSTALLVAGGVLWLLARESPTGAVVDDALAQAADRLWVVGALLGLAAAVATTAAALRERRPTVDVIAVLALAGALAVDEPFAGAMITVMLASGQLLEARAQARARRDLTLLVARAPRTARRRAGDAVATVDVDDVAVGDRLLVGTGEVVPVDGRLLADAVLDESALTGEPTPVERSAGDDVRSGVVNAGPPTELVATALAQASTYAGVVRLVEQAQATSAPFVRTADRVAVAFVPLTLVVAVGAWALSGDPVRAVAVLVVATPCPLLLAVPVAIMSGISRAARFGAVLKGGSALERLAAGRTILFDKTGTLTRGHPALSDVVAAPGHDPDEVLRLAASLDQLSPHPLASSIVTAATRRGLTLTLPAAVEEVHGRGVRGEVAGHAVRLGKAGWVGSGDGPWAAQVRRRADLDGSLTVFVAVDDESAGALLLDDPVRPDAPRMVRALRQAGIRRVVLVTGDRADVAQTVGRVVGVDTVLADHDPSEKVAAVRAEQALAPTIMVGDGINDAPALAAAGVGVALAARGATASSEAADVVLTVDRVDALADAILVARRSGSIARQAVVVGMGASAVAMGVAAAGLLPPAAGAVLQEGIDVVAIFVALRAVLPGRLHSVVLPPADLATARRLRAEHEAVLPVVEQLREVADRLTTTRPDLGPARALLDQLEQVLVPHELADEAELVPLATRALGGPEAAAALSRTHAEIEHQVTRLRRLLDAVPDGPPDEPSADRPAGRPGDLTGDPPAETVRPEDVVELRRLLYGLYGVLRLHNAQEEEWAFSLLPGGPGGPGGAGGPGGSGTAGERAPA